MNYIDITGVIHLVYFADQKGDFDLKIEGWKQMMPCFFSPNKTNYSRYGSYHIEKLRLLENTDSDSLALIQKNGISEQAQERYPVQTAIDQRESMLKEKGEYNLRWSYFSQRNRQSKLPYCIFTIRSFRLFGSERITNNHIDTIQHKMSLRESGKSSELDLIPQE